MFPNIFRELAAHNRMSIATLAKRAGIGYKSMLNKLNGVTEFTRKEMVEIQKIFGDIPLDELFQTGDRTA